jgi:cytochrome c oxidase subunit IV
MSHAAHASHDHAHHDDAHHAHGHIVVGWKLQLGVLAALLFFTALTVGFYNAEKWAETAFDIHLPGWVNIVGAMSIASIKATLVCMFFMQLRYDKAINTFALLFCLFAVGLFLFFSMLDLSTRGRVNEFKFGEIRDGGTGVGLFTGARDPRFDARVSPRIETGGQSLSTARRQEYLNKWMADHPGSAEIDFWAYWYGHVAKPRRHPGDEANYFAQLGLDKHPDAVSTANRTIPRSGLSGALDLAEQPAHGSGHDAGHDTGHDGH